MGSRSPREGRQDGYAAFHQDSLTAYYYYYYYYRRCWTWWERI